MFNHGELTYLPFSGSTVSSVGEMVSTMTTRATCAVLSAESLTMTSRLFSPCTRPVTRSLNLPVAVTVMSLHVWSTSRTR